MRAGFSMEGIVKMVAFRIAKSELIEILTIQSIYEYDAQDIVVAFPVPFSKN